MNFSQTATIPALARKMSAETGKPVSRRTLFYRLMKLHADRSDSPEGPGWLFRYAGGPWRVNLQRLKAAHPEMFDGPTNRELDTRLRVVEQKVESVTRLSHATAGALRRHREHETKAG